MNKRLLLIFFTLGCISNSMESARKINLETTIVSGEGFETNLRDTPKTIYIVTSDEIKKSGAQNIVEALKLVPGVKASEGEDGKGIIDIRGQGKQYDRNTAILIDGIKMNPIEMTKFDYSSIDIDNVEKIEVIPGNAAVLYGDNTVGGAVNIITKSGDFSEFIKLKGEAGTYNTIKRGVSFSSSIDSTNIFGNYNKKTSDGYRDNQRYDYENIEIGTKHKLDDKNDILFKYNYLNGYRRDPGKLNDKQLEEDKTQSTSPNNWGKNESNRFTGAYRYHKNNLEVLNQTSYYKNNYYSQSSSFDGKVTEDITNNLKIKYIFGKNKLVTGIDYFNGETKVERKKTWAKKDGYGVFLSNTYNFTEKLSLQGGYRRQETNFSYSVSGKEKEYSIDVYDTSLNYKYSDTGSMYISFGKDFRTPLTNEVLASNGYLNEKMKPQEGYNLEIGGTDYINNIFISSAIFYKKIKDEIYLDVSDKSGGSWGTNTNYDGKSEKIGYELLLEKQFTEKLSIKGSYSYISSKFISGEFDGKEIPGVSKNKFGLEFDYKLMRSTNINLTGNYIGSSYALSDEYNKGEKVDSYITWDLNVSYLVKENLNIYAGIKNLTDENYYERVQEVKGVRSYYPAMERRYYAGFEYKIY